MNAADQQERLSIDEKRNWFLAGIIEGEGSVCVSIKEHKHGKFGYLLDPEFFIYQHKNRREILELAKRVFGTGRIYPKPGNNDVLVFAIDARRSLVEKVLPFLDKFSVFSSKLSDYGRFKKIVYALERKEHWTKEGMVRIVRLAYLMNMEGKQRKRDIQEVIDRILRDYTPDSAKSGEDIVRTS